MAEIITFFNGTIFLETKKVNSDEFILWCVKTVFGQAAADARVARTLSGKPSLMGVKAEVSLSHTKGLTAVAVSSRPIGIDVECLERTLDYQSLSRRYFTECKTNEAFLLCWTAAEANAKREGTCVSDWFGKTAIAQYFRYKNFVIAVSVID